ncbi:unnamed protein product [Schistocephalus solidus]|uniref:Spermatogenesis-associated protein 13 n=1 Tax=Schistocephalus solidus TaxID=70667 RepID=A0A183SSL3_SCHSO|nr:unnamed protein product [Schistocephalus solidus]
MHPTILGDEREPCRDSRIHAESHYPPYVAPPNQVHFISKGPSIGHRLVSFFRGTFKRTSNGARVDAVPEQAVGSWQSTRTPVVSYLHKTNNSYQRGHTGAFPNAIKPAASSSAAGEERTSIENLTARNFRNTQSEVRRSQTQPNSVVNKSVADKQILAYSYVHTERNVLRKKRVGINYRPPNNQSSSNSSNSPQATSERPSLIVSPEASTERRKSGVTRKTRFSLHPSTPKAPTALIKQRPEMPTAGSSTEAPSFYSSSIQLSVTPVAVSTTDATEGQKTSKAHSRVAFQATGETKYVPIPAASSHSCLEAGRKPVRREIGKTDSKCLCSPVQVKRPSRRLLSPPPQSNDHSKPFTSTRDVQFGLLEADRSQEDQATASTETGGMVSKSKDDERPKLLSSTGASHNGDNFIEPSSSLLQTDRLNYLTQFENTEHQRRPMRGSRTRQRDYDRHGKVRRRAYLGYEKCGIRGGEDGSDDDENYRGAGSVPHRDFNSFGDDATLFDSSLLWSIEHELEERSSDEDTLDVLRVMKEVESSFRMEEQANLLSEEPTREVSSFEKFCQGASCAAERAGGTPDFLSPSEEIASSNFSSDSRKILELQEEPLPDQQVETLKIPSHWRIYAETHRRECHRRGVENNPPIYVSVLVHQLPIDIVLKSFEDPVLNTKSVQTYCGLTSYSVSAEAIQKKISKLGTPRGENLCRTEVSSGSPRRLCRYHRYLYSMHGENCGTKGLSRTQSASSCRLPPGGRCSKRRFADENLQRSLSVPNLQTTSDPSKLSGQEYQDYILIYKLWREINSSLKELQQLAGSPRGADVGTLTSPVVRSARSNDAESATLKDEEPSSVELLESSLQISSPKEFSEICLSPIPKNRTVDTSQQRIAELRELISKRSGLRQQLATKPQTTEARYRADRAAHRVKLDTSRGVVSELAFRRGTRSLSRSTAKLKAVNKIMNAAECAFEPPPYKRYDLRRAAYSGRNEEELREYSVSTLPSRNCTESKYIFSGECGQKNSKGHASREIKRKSGGPLTSNLATIKAAHAPAFWGDSTETESSGDDDSQIGSSVNLPATSPPRHMVFHRLPTTCVRDYKPKGSTTGSLKPGSAVGVDREEKRVNRDALFRLSRPVVIGDSARISGSFGDGRSKSWDREIESMRNVEWEDLINKIYAAKTSRGLRSGGHRATFQLTPSSQLVREAPQSRPHSSLTSQSGKVRPALRDNLLRHTFASLQKVRERKEDGQGTPRKPWVKY